MGKMTFLAQSTRYLFSLVLLSSFPLYAQEVPQVDVQLTSPLVSQVDPGKIVTASFLVTNNSNNEEEFLARIKLPDGWQTIPFKQVKFSVEPGEQALQILAIKIPKNYPSGQFKLQYLVQGLNDPSLTRVQDFFVYVLPHEMIGAVLLPAPKNIEGGESYETFVSVINNGNVASEISIVANTSLKSSVIVDSEKLTLKPQEEKKVAIKVQTKTLPGNHSVEEVLSVKLEPSAIYLSTKVEIFPKQSKRFDPYLYLPSTMSFGYGMKNEQLQVYGQFAGRGFLDEKQKRNLDYYALLPMLNQFNVFRNLGGRPEKAYLHYWDENIDGYFGEGQYTLTPLTMRSRFGKGASLIINPGSFKIGGLYVDDTSSVPRKNGAGFITFAPNKDIKVTSTYLYTDLSKNSDEILEKKEKTSTGSIRAKYTPSKKVSIDSEYSTTFNATSSFWNKSSIYFRAILEPKRGWSFGLEKILAKPEYVGYYNNTDVFSVSTGAPIHKRLRGFYSCNLIKTNLNESPTRSKSNYRAHMGGLSQSFNFGLYGSLSYNNIKSANRGTEQETQFGRINLGQNFKKCSLQTIIELGEQHSPNWTNRSRFWQNYQMYFYLQPAPTVRYAIFGNFGNVILNEFADKRYTLGSSLSWNYSKRLKLYLMYDQSLYPKGLSRRQCTGTLDYTFRSGHQFGFQSNYYSLETEKTKYEFLLTYTVPWKLPVGKKKSVSSIKGKIHRDQQSMSRLVVNCDGQRILTDRNGEFTFNSLTPGTHDLYVEEADEFVFCEKLPIKVNLTGGKRDNIELNTAPPGRISGTIVQFGFEKDSWAKGSNEQEVIFHKGLESVLVQVQSEDQKQVFQESTNNKGEFSFDRLKPGKWRVIFVNLDVPMHHVLDHKEFTVELSPGEKQMLSAKILPVVRRMHFIDSGEVN